MPGLVCFIPLLNQSRHAANASVFAQRGSSCLASLSPAPGANAGPETIGSTTGRFALSGAQSRPNGLDYLRPRRQYAQSGPGPTVNHCLAVDKYLELPVRSTDQLDRGLEFAPQSRRHTDGVQPGHSIRARANLNSGHAILRSGDIRSRCPSSYALSAPACPPNTRISCEGGAWPPSPRADPVSS